MAIIRRGARVRRKMDWFATGNQDGGPAEGVNQDLDVVGVYKLYGPSTSTDELREFIDDLGERTLTRIRGNMFASCVRASGDATTQAILYAMGIYIMDVDSFIAGQVVPNPIEEPDRDWLWYHSGFLGWRVGLNRYYNGTSGVNYDVYIGGQQDYERIVIDCRAQRRLKKGELPVLMVYATQWVGNPQDILLFGRTRTLLKE